MFAFFENRIRPTAHPGSAPPAGLLAFYWHYVRQTKGLFLAMFATGLGVALIDTVIPVFIGHLVRLMEATEREAALRAPRCARTCRCCSAWARWCWWAGHWRCSSTASCAATRSCPASRA
ncbi:MAG: hypothetical protein ABT20_18060 [Rubrivivax sp. SCN 70-15]|nr:MAG: hypothetical protein ABT20_18060 [Rubrivivax sp. SCN 70-15]